jgi:TRAP-type C4-dicarboxylate transport system permease small subunit
MRIKSAIKNISDKLETGSSRILGKIWVIGGIAIVAMMALIVIDALGKKFINLPIFGTYELTVFLLIIVFFASLAYCTIEKGHFVIDIVTSRLSGKSRDYLNAVMYLITTAVTFLLASQLMAYALKTEATNLTGTQFVTVPMYIFVLFGFLCVLITGWAFLLQTVAYFIKAAEAQ